MSVTFESATPAERRGKMPPIPPDFESLLNQEQRNALRNIENFGWRLAFVRRPMFEAPLLVVASPDQQRYATLESDGEVNMEPQLILRH